MAASSCAGPSPRRPSASSRCTPRTSLPPTGPWRAGGGEVTPCPPGRSTIRCGRSPCTARARPGSSPTCRTVSWRRSRLELQLRQADGDDVAVLEEAAGRPAAVDEHAVARPEIHDLESPVIDGDAGVPTRHGSVSEADRIVGAAPDAHRLPHQRKSLALVEPLLHEKLRGSFFQAEETGLPVGVLWLLADGARGGGNGSPPEGEVQREHGEQRGRREGGGP